MATVDIPESDPTRRTLIEAGMRAIKVRVLRETQIFPITEDQNVVFNRDDTVRENLDSFLEANSVQAQFWRNLVFRDADGIVLDCRKSMEENFVKDGDTVYLITMTASVNVFDDPWNWIISVCIALFLSTVFVMITLVLWDARILVGDAANLNNNYGVVIDAGSVHTTINVYSWPIEKVNGTGVVSEEYACESDSSTGVSSFALDPKAVQPYLMSSKCFAEAQRVIPEPLRPKSIVFLGATAGMRVLNATNSNVAQVIMDNVAVALNNSQLKYSDGNARIMSGSDEGVLGWITANYLRNYFRTNSSVNDTRASTKPFGALDWGGASSQITFVLGGDQNEIANSRKVILYGETYNVFTASHLCYGQAEALRRYFVQLVHKQFETSGKVSTVLKSPCQPRPDVYSVSAKELFYSPCTKYKTGSFRESVEALDEETVFEFVGESRHTDCVKEVDKGFNSGLCKETYEEEHCFDADVIPRPSVDTSFLAFSTYWYMVSFLNVSQTHLLEPHFTKVVRNLCSSDASYARRLLGVHGSEVQHNSCFKGIFMRRLLNEYSVWKESNGDNLTSNVEFVKRIADAEVGWTLGYMIQKTNDLTSVEIATFVPRNQWLYVCAVLLGFCILYILYVIVRAIFSQANQAAFARFVENWRNNRRNA